MAANRPVGDPVPVRRNERDGRNQLPPLLSRLVQPVQFRSQGGFALGAQEIGWIIHLAGILVIIVVQQCTLV